MEVTPRTSTSSTLSVDISTRGIAGQEDNEDNAVDLSYTNVNNDSQLHGIQSNINENINTPSVRGNNRTIKMILLTQCLAG